MPQSERSQIIKAFLVWLEAKSKGSGATIQQCINYIIIEVTEMGSTQKRAKSYIESCHRAKLLYTDGMKFKITEEGKNWLQRKKL